MNFILVNNMIRAGDIRDGGRWRFLSFIQGFFVYPRYRSSVLLIRTQLFLLILLSKINLSAQPSIQWQKCLGGTDNDLATSLQQTTDGGYIVAGSTESNNGNVSGNHGADDFWVVKLDGGGNIQWQKCLGGSASEEANAVQQTADGGYIVSGYTLSNNGDVSGNHGNEDFWVLKLTNGGIVQWQKCLGGTERDLANSVQQTSDGGFIIAGYTYSNNGDVTGNHGNDDYWVVKLDSLGNIQWQKCLGGTESDYANAVQQLQNGDYLVAGYTYSNNGDVSGNHGSYDIWVVQLSSNGTIQWQKCLGGTAFEFAYSIRQVPGGGILVAGSTGSNNGDVTGNHNTSGFGFEYDQWIVMLSSSGNLLWQRCLGGTDQDIAFSAQQTTDGGFAVGGNAWSLNGNIAGSHGFSDFWLVKLDASANLQWQKCLGGSSFEMARASQQTVDGGYILAGFTLSNNGDVSGNHGSYDAWVVKLFPVSSPLPIELADFYADEINQGMLLAWTTLSEIDNDFFTVERSGGGEDWDEIGKVVGAGNSATPRNYSFVDAWPFWGLNYYRLRQTDYDGSFSYSKAIAVNYLNRRSGMLISTVYPNPARGKLMIRVTETASVQILDLDGREVLAPAVLDANKNHELNTQALDNGIYLLKAWKDDRVSMKRVVINN